MKELGRRLKQNEFTLPFFSALIAGLLTHMYLFVNKFPNSDAMTNFYFDQNMVTSGRWFLMPACGISSFYDLNWMIGILSVFYLAVAAVLLCDFFQIRRKEGRILIPVLMVTFPAVTATAAYLYTMDGYMLGLILAILAAYLTRKYKWGFLPGAVCLAFSLGIYQAYLAFTILLCMFAIVGALGCRKELKSIWISGLKYLAMGGLGGILYYIILKICLTVQHKQLDTYQGLNEMGKLSLGSLPGRIGKTYYDFAAFALRGKIYAHNGFSWGVVVLLFLVVCILAILLFIHFKAYQDWYRLPLILIVLLLMPVGCNAILLMSDDAYYHLLMRMQWVLFPVMCVVLLDKAGEILYEGRRKYILVLCIAATVLTSLLCYRFVLSDNIAYFNMNERYEKTYAYCIRLLDRIEQTPEYRVGMPIAMIGVVNEENYPDTDITGEYTERITGTNGSIFIYSSIQYAEFMKHYLNFTFEPVLGEEMIRIYNSEEYRALESFPAANSMKVVDGILYIKTE